MKLSSFALLLGSLLVGSLAVAGCAADTAEPSPAEDTNAAADDLSARSLKLVGSYGWRAVDSGDFVDFEQITLKADGSYAAQVDAGLVNPAVRCIRFPCTLAESGGWSTSLSSGKLTLKVTPAGGKPARRYVASLASPTHELSLTAAGRTTVLFSAQTTCANVRCTAGTHCEMKGINGGAIPVCIQDPPPPLAHCSKSGCSGQICADHSVITTCEWRPSYACYRAATCERQADGQCGFTPSAALTSCLAANP